MFILLKFVLGFAFLGVMSIWIHDPTWYQATSIGLVAAVLSVLCFNLLER